MQFDCCKGLNYLSKISCYLFVNLKPLVLQLKYLPWVVSENVTEYLRIREKLLIFNISIENFQSEPGIEPWSSSSRE